nr:GNAT family N-acetyltransferase [Tianweitania aestuarii]
MTAADLDAFKALRLEALQDSPEAFGASPADEDAFETSFILGRCAPPPPGLTLGAFDDQTLIGMAAYVPESGLKTRHKAKLVSVYLKPSWRKSGVGRAMVEAIIAHARQQRVILQCNATMHNLPARRLYHALGFVPYGVERDALVIDGQGFDEELLMLDLRGGNEAET